MPRLIIALLRHADYQQLPNTPSAHQPFPLTEKGRQQALQAAANIQQQATKQGWHLHPEIHSSRLLRAWETATILAEGLPGSYQITSHDALAERSMGSAANLTVTQVEAIIQQDPRFESLPADWKSNSHFRLPLLGAESLMEAGDRVARHLESCAQQLMHIIEKDTLLIIVGHGAAIRHAAYVLGILSFDDIADLSMYHAEPVYIEYQHTGWTQIAGQWKVRNQTLEID